MSTAQEELIAGGEVRDSMDEARRETRGEMTRGCEVKRILLGSEGLGESRIYSWGEVEFSSAGCRVGV